MELTIIPDRKYISQWSRQTARLEQQLAEINCSFNFDGSEIKMRLPDNASPQLVVLAGAVVGSLIDVNLKYSKEFVDA